MSALQQLLMAYGASAAGSNDPFFSNVVMLLPMNDSNGSTTFTDVSAAAHPMTAQGNAQISTAQSRFGGSSGLFDGAGDYVETPAAADLLLGNGNFTVEQWVRQASNAVDQKLCGIWSDTSGAGFSWKLSLLAGGLLRFVYSTTGSNFVALDATSGAVALNTQTHVAVTRQGDKVRLFAAGAKVDEFTVTDTFFAASSAKAFEVGRDGAGNTEFYDGYMGPLRITKGIARYTADFTAPTAAFPTS